MVYSDFRDSQVVRWGKRYMEYRKPAILGARRNEFEIFEILIKMLLL